MSSTASATPGAAILLVDDNEVSAEIMGMTLEDLGHTIALAGDGKEALNFLESEPSVKLVITDLAMPEMDGLELVRHIKKSDKFRDVQVILLTGSDDEGLVRKAADAGCTNYLVKPVHPKLLLELVQEMLGPEREIR
jgi:CheY-like chemotaxis protein